MIIETCRVEIKPGVVRSVHRSSTGRAHWVTRYNGKYISVGGRIHDETFIADEQFQHIVDEFTPIRRSFKNAGIISKNPNFLAEQREKYRLLQTLPTLRVKVDGVERIVARKTFSSGRISYKGKSILGQIIDDTFTANDPMYQGRIFTLPKM